MIAIFSAINVNRKTISKEYMMTYSCCQPSCIAMRVLRSAWFACNSSQCGYQSMVSRYQMKQFDIVTKRYSCAYVCTMHVCIYVRMHVCMDVLCVCVWLYGWTEGWVYMYVCIHVCMIMFGYVHELVCDSVRACMCVYVCVRW